MYVHVNLFSLSFLLSKVLQWTCSFYTVFHRLADRTKVQYNLIVHQWFDSAVTTVLITGDYKCILSTASVLYNVCCTCPLIDYNILFRNYHKITIINLICLNLVQTIVDISNPFLTEMHLRFSPWNFRPQSMKKARKYGLFEGRIYFIAPICVGTMK